MTFTLTSSVELPIGARVAQIQQLMASMQAPAPAAAQATDPSTSFAGMLAQASAPSQTPAASSSVGGSTPYGAEIDAAAAKYGIDPHLLAGLVKQESGFDPRARSGVGALGLTQLMPQTAASLGVTDATDPVQALDGGAKYLRQQLDRFGGNVSLALAAYNAGPGNVTKYGGIPPFAETQNYVKNVLANAGMTASTPAVSSSPTDGGVSVT